MTPAVTAIVVAGLLLAIALGAAFGLDATGLILLALIGVFGVLAVSLARKARAGTVQPDICPSCGGSTHRTLRTANTAAPISSGMDHRCRSLPSDSF